MPAASIATIRRLGPGDAAAYKRLRDERLAAHPDAFTSDAATERLRSAESYVPRFGAGQAAGGDGAVFTLGAWSPDERLIGAASCERDPRIKVSHIATLVGMMVEPAWSSRGIGRALLERCIDSARACPEIELLTLSVTSSNERAVALYRHAGFERFASLADAIKVDGRYYAKDQMVLRLAPRRP